MTLANLVTPTTATVTAKLISAGPATTNNLPEKIYNKRYPLFDVRESIEEAQHRFPDVADRIPVRNLLTTLHSIGGKSHCDYVATLEAVSDMEQIGFFTSMILTSTRNRGTYVRVDGVKHITYELMHWISVYPSHRLIAPRRSTKYGYKRGELMLGLKNLGLV